MAIETRRVLRWTGSFCTGSSRHGAGCRELANAQAFGPLTHVATVRGLKGELSMSFPDVRSELLDEARHAGLLTVGEHLQRPANVEPPWFFFALLALAANDHPVQAVKPRMQINEFNLRFERDEQDAGQIAARNQPV